MEPSFLLSYYRPWDENSRFVDSWGDYIRDKTMTEYGASLVGSQIKEASREQINAIRQASELQIAAIDSQTKEMKLIGDSHNLAIRQAAEDIGFNIAEVKEELSILNRRIDISREQLRLSLILQKNIAELLKIPNSEKERQQAITLGIQFFVNASKDPDLFDDALEEFLKAESMKKQDYFVLHRIGLIYLYAEKHLDPSLAIDYFTRAGKYAAAESSPDALRLTNILTNSINEEYTQSTSDPSKISLLAADSYEKAALAYYILGNDQQAVSFQEKALLYDNSAKNYFNLAKYLIRSGNTSLSINKLETAIDQNPKLIDGVFCDADLIVEPQIIHFVKRKNSEVDNALEEIVIKSFNNKKAKIKNILCYDKIASCVDNWNYIEKTNALSALSDKAYLDELDVLASTLEKRFKAGFISSDEYSLNIDLLSVGNKSLEERQESSQKVRLFLNNKRPKVGDRVNGGVIVNINSDGTSGLMCADQMIGPDVFSEKDIPEEIINSLTSDDGTNNSQILISIRSTAAIACKRCRIGGYDDWYLPSMIEINYIVMNAPEILPRKSETIWTSSSIEQSGTKGICYLDPYFQSWLMGDVSASGFILPVRKFRID